MSELTFDKLPEAVFQLFQKLDSIEKLLQGNGNQAQATSDELLSIKQASQFLNLSVPTLYGYVNRKAIPHSKPGKHLYFSKAELMAWVQQGRKKTMFELKNEALTHLGK